MQKFSTAAMQRWCHGCGSRWCAASSRRAPGHGAASKTPLLPLTPPRPLLQLQCCHRSLLIRVLPRWGSGRWSGCLFESGFRRSWDSACRCSLSSADPRSPRSPNSWCRSSRKVEAAAAAALVAMLPAAPYKWLTRPQLLHQRLPPAMLARLRASLGHCSPRTSRPTSAWARTYVSRDLCVYSPGLYSRTMSRWVASAKSASSQWWDRMYNLVQGAGWRPTLLFTRMSSSAKHARSLSEPS
mmetsp:Transcript_33260/g.84298  ORF Transcript_33260/g.84298 Transcript_33260/m.84298 type:complete len:241 (-) Transcript_33260:754-1476(-)